MLAYGLSATVDSDKRISCHEDIEALITRAEKHLQAQSDAAVADGIHTVRSRTNIAVNPIVVVLGPGVPDTARASRPLPHTGFGRLAPNSALARANTTVRGQPTGCFLLGAYLCFDNRMRACDLRSVKRPADSKPKPTTRTASGPARSDWP